VPARRQRRKGKYGKGLTGTRVRGKRWRRCSVDGDSARHRQSYAQGENGVRAAVGARRGTGRCTGARERRDQRRPHRRRNGDLGWQLHTTTTATSSDGDAWRGGPVAARSGVAAQSSSTTGERGGKATPSLSLQRLGWDCWNPTLQW
jgi:hypothetical protein